MRLLLAALRLRSRLGDRESEWSSRLRFGEFDAVVWLREECFPLALGDSSLDEEELLLLYGPAKHNQRI